jgi:hypothetical protein
MINKNSSQHKKVPSDEETLLGEFEAISQLKLQQD